MNLNITTDKLERIVRICHAPSAGRERTKAELVKNGVFGLDLTFAWLLDLAHGTKNVDERARTPGIRLAATEALMELAPLVADGAQKGDVILKCWERRARNFLSKNSNPPVLRMA
jgi:hypothetical protein